MNVQQILANSRNCKSPLTWKNCTVDVQWEFISNYDNYLIACTVLIISKWRNNFATVRDVYPLLVCSIKHMTLAIHKRLYEKSTTENCL